MKNLLRVLAVLVTAMVSFGVRAGALGNLPGPNYLGDVVIIDFDSFASTGASSATTGLATGDVKVYKYCGSGSFSITEFSNSGYTLVDTDGLDVDGRTGFNAVAIDTGDAGNSWAAGCDYLVNIDSVTIDSQTVRMTARFKLDPNGIAFGSLSADSASTATAKVGTTGLTSDDQYKYDYVWNVTTSEKRCITTTDDNTVDVITFSPNSAAVWHTSDKYRIMLGDGPCSPITQPSVSGAGGVYIAGFVSSGVADVDSDIGTNFKTFLKNGGVLTTLKIDDVTTSLAAIKAETDTIGSPVNMGSGASLASNQIDANGVLHYGTCDGSSTVSVCNSVALTEADEFWDNWTAIQVAGEPPRCVRRFANSTHRLTWDRPLPSTSASKAFVLRTAPECRNVP